MSNSLQPDIKIENRSRGGIAGPYVISGGYVAKEDGSAVAQGNGIDITAEGSDVVADGNQCPAPEIHRGHIIHYVCAEMLADVI